ncbi:DUF3817 domain-containing protein [Fulvivirga sp. M361]|uniref:DUF3817 domain-containing protein n=1 Tax=Fulvivirga sp. M361 TaxID=2594266 RepID=UPI00117A33A5|nr:DUF3817 domain-containing protein [Fulvivirga sp. M361]TRX60650.1 DUF3817 domain-containing protein [Fulvivirga sp. M361]
MSLLRSTIGRLRFIAILEGTSLILLLFVAVPLKRVFDFPMVSKLLEPIHGALFLLFVLNTVSTGIEEGWKFKRTTWKVLLAGLVPFGTFYIDYKILKSLYQKEAE